MSPIRVLLVEDTRDDESLTLRGLRGIADGIEVSVVRDGAAALDHLQSGGPLPALVIVDLKLPKVDGAEVLRRIRENEGLRHLCVVVFTSSSEPRDISRCYALGCNSYVIKPVAYESYIDAVRQISRYWLQLNTPPRD
ncbi:MAG: response regulator [Betaproteobacteria bacterium]|nr:response regulator [Betaproteobacteria bacterium]